VLEVGKRRNKGAHITVLGNGKREKYGSMHHYTWKWERGKIREHTSLCLEVGKGRNKGAHITGLGSRMEEKKGKYLGWKRKGEGVRLA
jgi:hypothetical protein